MCRGYRRVPTWRVVLSGMILGASTPAMATEQALSSGGPTVAPATPPAGTIGKPYAFDFDYTGDGIHVSYGKLPQGLTLADDGTVSGTIAEKNTGSYTFTLSAYTVPEEDDQWPETADRTFTIQVGSQRNYTTISDSDLQWARSVGPLQTIDDGSGVWCPPGTPYLIGQRLTPVDPYTRVVPSGVSLAFSRDDLQTSTITVRAAAHERDGLGAGIKDVYVYQSMLPSPDSSDNRGVTLTLHCTNAQNEAQPA